MVNGVPVQTGLLSAKDVETSRNTDTDSKFSNPYNSVEVCKKGSPALEQQSEAVNEPTSYLTIQ